MSDLNDSSLTGQSKQLKRYVEKYNLHDLKVGDKLPEGVPPFKSEDYEDNNVVNIKDKKDPQ